MHPGYQGASNRIQILIHSYATRPKKTLAEQRGNHEFSEVTSAAEAGRGDSVGEGRWRQPEARRKRWPPRLGGRSHCRHVCPGVSSAVRRRRCSCGCPELAPEVQGKDAAQLQGDLRSQCLSFAEYAMAARERVVGGRNDPDIQCMC